MLGLPVWGSQAIFTYIIGIFFQLVALFKISGKIAQMKVFWFYLLSLILKILVIVGGLLSLYFILGKTLFIYSLTQGFSFEFVSPKNKYQFLALAFVLWLLLFLSCFFYFLAFKEIGQKTQIKYFKTGATISLFAGIFYFTILGGIFLDLLAQCLIIVGFFLLPERSV